MIIQNSSMVKELSYVGKTLRVTFVSGAKYAYTGVPQNIYNGFINAPSKGKYFLANIKDRYDFIREA